MISAIVVFISCAVGLTRAIPTALNTGCPVAQDTVPLPTGQTALTVPQELATIAITLGVGTQNYTCSDAGNYTSIGAVANLYDISCQFDAIASLLKTCVGCTNDNITGENVSEVLDPPSLFGRHYFVNNPTGSGLSPTFDCRADSKHGDNNAFVIASKVGDIPSPSDSGRDVDWLELEAIPNQGDLAKRVFRIDTYGGQPPASCTPGSPPILVPYHAVYWFYN